MLVPTDEPLTSVRIAVNTRNGEALVALLDSGPWPDTDHGPARHHTIGRGR